MSEARQRLEYRASGLAAHEGFWGIIERSQPSVAALAASLGALSAAELVAFGALLGDAKRLLAEAEGADALTEEDPGPVQRWESWVVSQGRARWAPLLDADASAWQAAYHEARRGEVWEQPVELFRMAELAYEASRRTDYREDGTSAHDDYHAMIQRVYELGDAAGRGDEAGER